MPAQSRPLQVLGARAVVLLFASPAFAKSHSNRIFQHFRRLGHAPCVLQRLLNLRSQHCLLEILFFKCCPPKKKIVGARASALNNSHSDSAHLFYTKKLTQRKGSNFQRSSSNGMPRNITCRKHMLPKRIAWVLSILQSSEAIWE